MTHLARKLQLIDYFALGFGTMVGTAWLVVMDDILQRGGPVGAILGFTAGALKKMEDPYSDRSYWALVNAGYLPAETADYVERYVAAAVAGEAGIPNEAVLQRAGY